MSRFALEDFGKHAFPRAAGGGSPMAPGAADRFDDGYNSGWDDAMSQVETEQTRVAERLAERLGGLEQSRQAATAAAIQALEPALRDIFDKLLPRTVERAFLPLLLEEVGSVLGAAGGKVSLHVAPEEEAAVTRLLERAQIGADRVGVRPEATLSISQALIRWDGQERRVDLEGVLTALDDALETFLATMDRGPTADTKEAVNG